MWLGALPPVSRVIPTLNSLNHEGIWCAFGGQNRSQAQMECSEKGLIKGIAGSQDPKEAGNQKQGVNCLQNSPARASIAQVSGLGPEPLPGGGWGGPQRSCIHSTNIY